MTWKSGRANFFLFQKLIELRKEHEILVKGSFKLILPDDPQIFAYERELGNKKWTVIANLSDTEQTRSFDDKTVTALISNYDKETYDLTDLELKLYEAFVFRN